MIVLHRCLPSKNIYQIFRLDLEIFLDCDLLGYAPDQERVKITLGAGRIRQNLKEHIIGPYHTDQMDALFQEARPVLSEKLEKGYGLAVARGFLAEQFRDDLKNAYTVKPWAMASAYEKAEEKKRVAARSAQEKAYLASLAEQGQKALPVAEYEAVMQGGFLAMPRQDVVNKKYSKGPTPRSRYYQEYIKKLGQLSLFDDAEYYN